MLSAIRRRDAVVVITGDPGTGKTMLCRAVMEELDRRTLTAFVADPLLPPDDLLKTVLVDFGVITREQLDAGHLASASRASLMAALRDFLASLTAIEAFAVMFIDEANLLSLDLLEQLRLITDLHEDARLLQIALVGEPPLISHLQRPELRAFSARIGARAAVGPLEREEILGYIRQRLLTAGVRPRVDFDDSALDALFAMSRGVPRTVNRLCDRALTLGAAASAGVIDAALIGRAAEECGVTAPPPVRAGRSVTQIARSSSWRCSAPVRRRGSSGAIDAPRDGVGARARASTASANRRVPARDAGPGSRRSAELKAPHVGKAAR